MTTSGVLKDLIKDRLDIVGGAKKISMKSFVLP
jgi:hypothetical protein